jgi:putative chitinase
MITVANLIDAGIAPTQARQFLAPLSAACARFSINTTARIAGFVAQCRVESAGFTALEEGLFYRDPARIMRIWPSRVTTLQQAQSLARNPQGLANVVYANRLGNGDTASGDGWRFRGRGLKQLTGKANYEDASEALARPYVTNPDLVALPEDACMTAAWFWHTNKCNILADSAQWDAITRVVNGPGMLQRDERRQYSDEGVRAFA